MTGRSLFFHRRPVTSLEDVRELHPAKHWQVGRSAQELARSWLSANDIPKQVKALLETNTAWSRARLIEGFFERLTPLETPGEPTHTDLMAFCCLSGRVGIMAVEGKAGEPFGPLVAEWNSTPGRDRRLNHLSSLLKIDKNQTGKLRWQLFHRAAAAVFEAEHWAAREALLLVHAFASSPQSEKDYISFAAALDVADAGLDHISGPIETRGVALRLGWVQDKLA